MKQGKISFLWIVLSVILLVIVLSGYLTISSNFQFAGLSWTDSGTQLSGNCNSGGGQTSLIAKEGKPLIISASGSSFQAIRSIKTDVTGIDELLVIYEGNTQCSGSQSGSGISVSILGSESGSVGVNKGGCGATHQPEIVKLKNNFDGTWSSLKGIGIGDVYILQKTEKISGNSQFLQVGADGGSACGLGGSASASITLYNVVRKEDAFAVCKADKYALDFNNDGKIANDGSECFDFASIKIMSEEAIKESFDEKIARITEELEAKNSGLTSKIQELQKQLAQQGISSSQITLLEQKIRELESQLSSASDKTLIQQQIDALRSQQMLSGNVQEHINALQSELRETKKILADVQAGDNNVINVIERQEEFKQSNFINNFFNKIIAWISNLLG